MKKIVISLLSILLCGLMSNTAYAVTNDPISDLENKIQQDLEKSGEDITFEEVSIDFEKSELIIEANTEEDDVVDSIELKQSLSESSELQIETNNYDGTSNNYSVYFGTEEQKRELDQALQEEQDLLRDVEEGKYSEDEISNLELPTKKIFEDETRHITTVEQLEETPIVVTDMSTNETTEINPEDGVASNPGFAIHYGIRVAVPVAIELLKIFFAAIVGGLLGLSLKIFAVNSNYRQYYEHYAAVRTGRVGLVVYSGMNVNTAVTRMRLGGDLWSTSSTGAFKIAKFAGSYTANGQLRTPISDKAHGVGNFPHYHTWNRSGGHSFYGLASMV